VRDNEQVYWAVMGTERADAIARGSRTPLVLALAIGWGCAGGVDNPNVTTFGPSPNSGPTPATSSDDESEGDEDPFPDPDPIDTTSGWGDETTSFGDETTSFGDGTTSVGDSTGDDGGSVGNCPNVAMCASAPGLGSISGDDDSSPIVESGSEPTWIEFQVTENDDALVGSGMSFTATLQSPAGANFDLYVYRGVEGGATGCNGFAQQSASPGPQDAVSMSWGEGVAANGLDDGVWVAVEIRAKDDMCAPPQEWTLTVEGNT
jgi:hypothetical protein